MANTIKLKRASGNDPGNSDLSVGELAIRTSNCKLFSKNDGGSAVGIVAGSADTLTTARTIAGVSFDGSSNISLNNNAITNGAGYLANIVSDTSPQLGGDLDLQSSGLTTSTSNGNIKATPNGSGVFEVRSSGSVDGTLQLNCTVNSHGIKLKSPPHSAGASYTLTFPNSIVNNGVLKTNSSGTTSFGLIETANINNDAITTQQIADGTIVNDDINASAAIAQSKLNIANATTSAAGYLSATDKSKLDGIAAGATNVTNTNQLTNGAGFITATLTQEQVEDYVGGMVTGNTESGITVTYQDSDGTLDFVVASQTDENFTTTLKNKLDGIATGATNVTNNNQLTNGAGYITATLTNEQVQDIVGAMVTGNTESGITVTYQDSDGTLDFSVASQTGSLNASNLSSGTIPDARFPSTLPAVDGSNLTGISAGATGGGSDQIFYENGQTVTTNYTITNGKNAMSAGPITINSGVTVTVGAGETLTIV